MTADAPETMIIGGGMVYSEAMLIASRIYLTEVDASLDEADTFFPEIDRNQYCHIAIRHIHRRTHLPVISVYQPAPMVILQVLIAAYGRDGIIRAAALICPQPTEWAISSDGKEPDASWTYHHSSDARTLT